MKATSKSKKSSSNKLSEVSIEKENKDVRRFQNILQQTPFAIAVFRGSNYAIEFANNSALAVLNKDENCIGKLLFDAAPELENPLKKIFDKVMQSGIPFQAQEMELAVLRNGIQEIGWFNLNFQAILEHDTTISGILASASEVTDHVIACKKIENSDKRNNLMLMNSPFGFAILKGKNMVISFANDSIKSLWGKGLNVEGKPLFDVISELKESAFPDLIDNVYKTGIPFYGDGVLAPILRNGNMEDVYFNFVYQPYMEADETISGVTIIGYDVTAQVIAKKEIEKSEQRFRSLVEKSPYPISIFKGKELKLELANEPLYKIFNVGEEVLGKPFLGILPEMKDQPFMELLLDVFENGVIHSGSEQPAYFVRENGEKETHYFDFVYQPYHENDGSISGVMSLVTDVTDQVLARKKIEESEERFRSLANNVPMHIFIIEPNAEASISYWNKNWLIYTGQTFEEAIGNSWNGIMHPDDLQSIFEVYVPAFKNRQPYFLPAIRIRRHDGEYRWHSVQANPRYLPTGEFMGYIGVGFDVHQQKLAQDALRQSEEHFRMLADLMPSKISNSDATGNVTYFNKHWINFSGYTFEELRDFGYHKIMHPDEIEEFQQLFKKAAETGTNLIMEMRFKNKEGDYIWHLNIASPIKDDKGKLQMWIGVTTEMQHQKEQREELEHAVVERTLALSASNEELKKINKELEAFTYVSSHDLQEPLRKLRTLAGRILEKEQLNLSDKGKNYFHLMQNAAERMQTLIQDLLTFSRINIADREFEIIDLDIIIEEVKKEFKETIAEKNAVIETKEICEVKIIPFQFRQLMHNLISNALKFSNPQIPPHILIESRNIKFSKKNILNLPVNTEYCHISIADNGIGFEKEFAEKIFEVFQKLHNKDEYPGTGIGLAIVKKIVENHNGIITATSELNKGSTFNVYIPV